MSAKGVVHARMKCPSCGRVVAYSDDAVNDRWLRRHGPRKKRCPERLLGNVGVYLDFWRLKGLLDVPPHRGVGS